MVKDVSLTALIPAGKFTVPDRLIDPKLLPTDELEVITTAPETVEAAEALLIRVPPFKRIGFEIV